MTIPCCFYFFLQSSLPPIHRVVRRRTLAHTHESRSEFMGKLMPGCMDPTYWSKRVMLAREWSMLHPLSSPDFDLSEDMSCEPCSSEEEQPPLTDQELETQATCDRRSLRESEAEVAWAAVESLHGWTPLSKNAYINANRGSGITPRPWLQYTKVSRDEWHARFAMSDLDSDSEIV